MGTKCNKLLTVSGWNLVVVPAELSRVLPIRTQILLSYPQFHFQITTPYTTIGTQIVFALAPKKKPTKFQLDMATSIEDLKSTMETMAKQLAGV